MKKMFFVTLAVLMCAAASAEEGMWMVNAISRALAKKIEAGGLKMSAGEIYNEDSTALCDAIVSLDFGCSGSIVSDRGLVITNHHCAYSDVHAISTRENNYLEDGFRALTDKDERYIPGKSIYFLKKVLDVTDEVKELIDKEHLAGKPMGMRKLSYILEKKYSKKTGLDASLSSMWSGSRYYLALYQVYTDIRLVVAPPVSIAAFGGDEDNWEWPQHKCDFAMYRIYAAPDGSPAEHSDKNVPLVCKRKLEVSTSGYRKGDFTMVLGYPGKTNRYTSSARLRYMQDVELPIVNSVRAEQMKIISSWMNKDPEIRLKYSDKFFSLSNVQELQQGEVECYKRFGTVNEKKKDERILKDYKGLLDTLELKYNAYSAPRKNFLYMREAVIRGTRLSLAATKMKNRNKGFDIEKEYAELDLRVEKDLFRHSIQTFYDNVDSSMWGPFQKEAYSRFGRDYDGMCSWMWTDGYMKKGDRIFKFFTDANVRDYNQAVDTAQGEPSVTSLNHRYVKAMYAEREKRGMLQYPDANSTMRLTWGKVGSFRRNGKTLPMQTFSDGILAKEDRSKYDFTLKDSWRTSLAGTRIPVNFITDCDITGGNSGSPVVNAKGQLIGLAFDGNKESLASDASYTKGYNKCVCVDIRFVLWTLDKYCGMDRILKEMSILPAE